jgi:hypothetical protein
MAELDRTARSPDCVRIEWTVAMGDDWAIAIDERHGAKRRHTSRCARLDVEGIDRLVRFVAP